jgi:hypothetical protein
MVRVVGARQVDAEERQRRDKEKDKKERFFR